MAATTPIRCRCGRPSTTSCRPRRAAGARPVAVLGDMRELGPDGAGFTSRSASRRAAGVDVLVAVGPLAAEIAEPFGGEVHSVPDAAAAASMVPALVSGRHRARQGLARGGPRSGLPGADEREPAELRRGGSRVMGSISGRVLIAGTASLLMCLFLSPSSSSSCAAGSSVRTSARRGPRDTSRANGR